MRRRNVATDDAGKRVSLWGEAVAPLKQLDAFPKTLDDFRVKTTTGATVTVITSVILVVLFFAELSLFFQFETESRLHVDTALSTKMRIKFDIQFHQTRCKHLQLDLMDQADNFLSDTEQMVVKTRLRTDGTLLPEQDGTEKFGEGCRIWGHVKVRKVAGNFHIALGHSSLNQVKAHVHEFKMSDVRTFNVSHYIHSISFGDQYPGQINPLDNVEKQVESGTAVFKYFVKVIPTEYQYLTGKVVRSNQFSVTEFGQLLDASAVTHKLPGIFFMYDFSALKVSVKEVRMPLSQFLIRCCAVLGGVFALGHLLDYIFFFFKIGKLFQKRPSLGDPR